MKLIDNLFDKDKTIKARVLENGIPTEELKEYLLKNYSVYDIAMVAAELIEETYCYTQPIALKEEEYNKLFSMFRIRGIRADGRYETRGNKSKVSQKVRG